jgi:ribulose-5-phosphate 4-epimerase/fuculose-1-phosphate aldolase
VRASNLVKVDESGEILSDPTGVGINAAGFVIHSAVHMGRPDVRCVMHTHTAAGMAVSTHPEGLLPITQHAMRFHERIASHPYEGIAIDLAERERLVKDLGDHNAMILENHGLLTCGRTVAEAFGTMYYLERACQAQVAARCQAVLRRCGRRPRRSNERLRFFTRIATRPIRGTGRRCCECSIASILPTGTDDAT